MENDRIKLLRTEFLHLSQEKFGSKIGVKKGAISAIEVGTNSVSSQIRASICREYNVSEKWLLTGEGEMFTPKASDVIDALADKYSLNDKSRIVVERFITLQPKDQEVILNFMEAAVKEILKQTEKSSGEDNPDNQEA